MFTDKIHWQGVDMGKMWATMIPAFLSTCKSLISGIPLPFIIVIGLIFLGMGIWQFLKDLKVL